MKIKVVLRRVTKQIKNVFNPSMQRVNKEYLALSVSVKRGIPNFTCSNDYETLQLMK